MQRCPQCNSQHTEILGDEEFSFLVCLDCGYDESQAYETPDERTKKGGKGSPYKKGGALRTQKKS